MAVLFHRLIHRVGRESGMEWPGKCGRETIGDGRVCVCVVKEMAKWVTWWEGEMEERREANQIWSHLVKRGVDGRR